MSRWVLRVAILVLLSSFIDAHAKNPPNILLIVSDDQAWGDFGFMGHEVVETPCLDKLAAESAVFINGYVPTSLCRASLASILTGQYPHQHKICSNDPPQGVEREKMLPFLQNTDAIPRLLQRKGYRSLQTGKFWEGHFKNGGFTHGMTTKGRHGEEGLAIGRETLKPIYDFIDSTTDAPFFIWYAPMLPHDPHTPPDRLLQKYVVEGRNLKQAKYWAMCEWFDETCGEILDHLEQKGLAENTLVAFIVDNGWIQETGDVRTTRGWFAPRSKSSPYEGGVRTPVMLRLPGVIPPGVHSDLVSSIDLMPTLLGLAGIETPPDRPGLDLLPVAKGAAPLDRTAVFGEIFTHDAVDLDRPASGLTHLWMREGDWKIIQTVGPEPTFELYNLANDPHEEVDLAGSHPGKVAELREKLSDWSDWR